ncbi:MAG TPA: pyruvate ferredoxin oxidoreductase subunit gamma [Candidatus Bathyarchaeota archaeon]|nr:pyruvate ferredoxin oxidoreductase subunit gamma [Candidatus Bathyarchaeota archaeon]
MLIEIRWHGRGGQGVVSVSRLLADAALIDGKYAQAFPEFGPERLGAPILGFTRISDAPIDIHSQIYTPHYVVVLDPTLLKTINVFEGLVENGSAVINTDKSPEEIKQEFNIEKFKVYTINATKIALEILGRPIYNTAMLGALVKASNLVSMESVREATLKRFKGEVGEKNVAVINKAYEELEVS